MRIKIRVKAFVCRSRSQHVQISSCRYGSITLAPMTFDDSESSARGGRLIMNMPFACRMTGWIVKVQFSLSPICAIRRCLGCAPEPERGRHYIVRTYMSIVVII